MGRISFGVGKVRQQLGQKTRGLAVQRLLELQQDPRRADLRTSIEPGAVALLESLPPSLQETGRPALAIRPALVLDFGGCHVTHPPDREPARSGRTATRP